MEQVQTGAADQSSLWRRIVDFPLVAMVIAIALVVLCARVSYLAGRSFLPSSDTVVGLASRAIVLIGSLLLVYKLVIVRLGEHPRDDLRLKDASKLALGLGAGFGLFCLVVGVAAAVDVYNIVGPGGFSDLARDLITAGIVAGFTEELVFRGILFRWIEEFAGSWAALAVTSALFGLVHIMNPNATWFSSFAIALEAGVLLGGAYMLTRSLWMPIGLHAGWNLTQGFIFDVPVSGVDENGLVQAKLSGPVLLSGGQFGLEASVIAMVIATAAGVWLVVLAVRRGQLMQPWWVRRRLAQGELPA